MTSRAYRLSAYVTKRLLWFTAASLCDWWQNNPLGLMTFTCSHCGLVQHHVVATCAALLLALPYVLSQTAANVCLPQAKSCDREQTQITHALCSVTNSPPTVCFIPANPHTHRWKRDVCVWVCVCVAVVEGSGGGRGAVIDHEILFVWWHELFCRVSKIKTVSGR